MNSYTYDQVFEASVKYFNGDELAAKVFVDKYALQNQKSEYLELTPTDMHHRLAKEFARIENKYENPISEEEIFSLIDHFKYIIPQGSPMSAIGNTYQIQSISNCFVVQGVYSDKLDSYGGIMMANQEIAQIFKRRGGCGIDISGIRPKDMPTANASKTTDGIAVFMDRFSNTCREVAQKGRRGALILTISINHPDIETFINIKKDLTKVTGANISIRITDEFMNAVKNNSEFILRYPIDKPIEEAKLIKKVKARDIWNQIVNSAWQSAEPGILFWDTIQRNTPSDIYKEEGYETISVNPCVSGDTLIAVADGRNAVTIKQLAEEKKDIPVYSIDENNNIAIKMGRNPRITGYNKKLLRIKMDDGSYLDATPEHNFILSNGIKIQAKDLKPGDSLNRFDKNLSSITKGGKEYYKLNSNSIINGKQIKKPFEHRLIAEFYYKNEWDEIYNFAKQNGFAKTGGLVIHHKDYNSLNNRLDNLQVMTFKDHVVFHNEKDNCGKNNGRYINVSSEEIKQHALKLTKSLGRRFSVGEWYKYSNENGLPYGSKFRSKEIGDTHLLSKTCAKELGYNFIDTDPRTVRTFCSLLKDGYNVCINENNNILFKKPCLYCYKEILTERKYTKFCSITCSNKYRYKNKKYLINLRKTLNDKVFFKQEKTRNNQINIYNNLKSKLGRDPFKKEWESECKKNNIPYRIGSKLKYCFKNFKDIKNTSKTFNHKVLEVIELDGEHTVYNLTVDDNHNYAVVIQQKKRNLIYLNIVEFLSKIVEAVTKNDD